MKTLPKFTAGDVVKLRSDDDSNPDMTVKNYTSTNKVVCNWRLAAQSFEEEYTEEQLRLILNQANA